ncbi:MAG: carboxypeptidase-like regulatory domain-containing protein, partial [Chitinophagales bacterium]|nr:carboxypeptidase-like regulatory domain-containing protein [Chitinophagales bacterium]
MKRVFICLSIVFSSFFCFGQNEVIQFSGLVVETFSREPTSFCAVYKKNSERGTIADDQGFFSLVVEKGDTIMFQCLGYKPKYIVVPSTVQNNSFIQTVLMETDAINLKELVIRPLPAPNLLRAAIVNV